MVMTRCRPFWTEVELPDFKKSEQGCGGGAGGLGVPIAFDVGPASCEQADGEQSGTEDSGGEDDSGGDDEDLPPARPAASAAEGGSEAGLPTWGLAVVLLSIAILALLGSHCSALDSLANSLRDLRFVDSAPLCGLMAAQLKLIHVLFRELTGIIERQRCQS